MLTCGCRNCCVFIRVLCVRRVACSFDGVLEHVLRIDRVLRQPMGHLLLVGEAGAGKTVLSRFVSWMNGLAIFQASAVVSFSHCIAMILRVNFLRLVSGAPKPPISHASDKLCICAR